VNRPPVPEWLDRAWFLYRSHRYNSPHPMGWFDDELWRECVRVAQRAPLLKALP
jgi:hypothetical protein